jgi:signal transduction histidine kinase
MNLPFVGELPLGGGDGHRVPFVSGLRFAARMNAPQDHDTELLAAGGLSAVVIRNKEGILDEFCRCVQEKLESARREPHAVLIDTLPAFITRVALALRGVHEIDYASKSSNLALAHGNERARFTTYSLADVLKEYQYLREILMDVLRKQASPTVDEWKIVHRSVDEAMAEAATAYVEVQEGFREMLTASLTHDFRGPLQTASNYLELMRREPDEALRNTIARRISENLQRVGRMIAGLLDASRSNAGERRSLDLAEASLRDLLEEIVADLDPGRRKQVKLFMVQSVDVFWDREKVRRAIHNLVDNACKYSTPQTDVTLRVVPTHDRVHVSVHNFGEPIAKEDQPSLFKAYRRTTSAQMSGKLGWGLGLTLVQAVAEAHGGSVGVESDPVNGTTFTIDLMRDVRDLRVKRV